MIVRHHTLWADSRMAEAFDLIDEVIKDHATREDGLPELKSLLAEVEKADELLAGILYERRMA